MVMIILGNNKNNYDIATKTAQWPLTPKQLNLVLHKKATPLLIYDTVQLQLNKIKKKTSICSISCVKLRQNLENT